ncbi:LamG domain-containing protein, partial [Candidatus Saccharibacteria bacterium]|nr:LamG domain-containing protein [Candidatus Saccharibacteria bacterium]
PVVIGRANGTEGWMLYIETDGRISLAGYNGALTNYSKVSSYQSLPLGKWVHVAAQLDMSAFTATSTTSYIMIDGVAVPAAVTRGGTNPTALVQAGNLEVGGFNGGTNPFDGKLAQVFYSSAKITQANIRTLISQGLTSALITTHSIVSAYSFDNSINDLNTTNANNLTAQNSAVATDTDSPFGNSGLSTTVEYAITTAISSDGLTETVQVPEGCALPTSGGITSMAYSPHKVPHGFPAERGKWSISRVLKADTNQSSPVQNTWYNLGYSMSIPVGAWGVFYEVSATAQNATNPSVVQVTLSTANNTESDKEATSHSQVNGATGIVLTQIRNVDITLSSATTYYLNLRTTTASGIGLGLNGSNAHPCVIKAECAYL